MSEPLDSAASAKAYLEAHGYVVLKATSYRKAQERQRLAEARRDWEVERREHTERWAHEAFAEQRRLSDRLTFVYGVARACGASVEDLAARGVVGATTGGTNED